MGMTMGYDLWWIKMYHDSPSPFFLSCVAAIAVAIWAWRRGP